MVESLPFFGNYDTRGATVESVPQSTSRGIWFKFVGGGGPIEVLLSSLTFDADLRFYTGSCGNLVPVVIPSWWSSSTTLRVPLSTTAGEQYFVLATGDYRSDVGTFGMEVTGAQVLVPVDDPPTESPMEMEDVSTASPTMQSTVQQGTQPERTLSPDNDSSLTNFDTSGAPCIHFLGVTFVYVGYLLIMAY